MKKIISVLITLTLMFGVTAANNNNSEKDAVKSVVKSAYVEGIQNAGNIDDIKKGFHPGFNLLGIRNNSLTKFPIYSWIESVKKRKEKEEAGPITTCEFEMIDITGNAAIVKIKLFREGKQTFTDYLSLYKFKEGWKIVNKIYHRH